MKTLLDIQTYVVVFVLVLYAVGKLWAKGIDTMNTHHKDYDGKDLFDEK